MFTSKKKEIDVTDKNLIDAIAYEKNLSVFLEDLHSNKDNWLVTNLIKNDQDNKIIKDKNGTIGCIKLFYRYF